MATGSEENTDRNVAHKIRRLTALTTVSRCGCDAGPYLVMFVGQIVQLHGVLQLSAILAFLGHALNDRARVKVVVPGDRSYWISN